MLQIKVPLTSEGWDEEKQEFVEPTYKILQLEHSLISLSKWESKWCKPFFSKEKKTGEQVVDYIKFMTITKNVDDEIYDKLSNENIEEINNYIEAPMTATTFSKEQTGKFSKEIITNEIIYYWMIALNIPFECQKWHVNHLLTLIRVCNVKNQPGKKMSKSEILSRNAALNAARRQQLNTRG